MPDLPLRGMRKELHVDAQGFSKGLLGTQGTQQASSPPGFLRTGTLTSGATCSFSHKTKQKNPKR